MRQRQSDLRPIGHVSISSLLLVGLAGPGVAPAQIFAAETERIPKGKPATKADFVRTVKDNLISLKAKNASLKEILEEIGRRMKIDVIAVISDTTKITAELYNLSVEEAVNRLSRNYAYVMDATTGQRKITKIIVLEKGKETAVSTPTTKKEEKPAKPESKAREVGKGTNESAINKEKKSVTPETKMREEAIKKESSPGSEKQKDQN